MAPFRFQGSFISYFWGYVYKNHASQTTEISHLQVCFSKMHATLVCTAAFSIASAAMAASLAVEDEPGTVNRGGVEVFKPAAVEQSEYLVSGTEDMLPPILSESTAVSGLTGTGVRLRSPDWSALRTYTNSSSQLVYDDFLNAMTFTSNSPSLTWPVDSVSGNPIPFLGATSISQLYGAFLSRSYFSKFGWHADYTPSPGDTDGFNFFGYPRVGATQDAQVPPSYPPLTQDLWASNSPLVPATVAGTGRAIYTERQSINGKLDLITGQPLLREVDLEIPFGSAVFRRIRTYSEIPGTGLQAHNWHDYGSWQRSRTAGWHGHGWMSSDAPLFLIDAGIAQTMTVPQGGRASAPRCIFALDAHQAIPFIRQVSPAINSAGNAGAYNVDYVAPEWFDALLLHSGGVWDGVNHRWGTYPTEFRVILNKRSVIYVIKPYYEDVDPSEHKLPTIDSLNSGLFSTASHSYFGVPYYGLVTEIRDRAGNRVVISYADGHRPFDGPIFRELYEPDPDNQPGQMEERDVYRSVRQRGWYKGMIDHVKLYEAGSQDASWTLLYTYRTFAAVRERLKEWNFWDHRSFPPALHSILVYEDDLNMSQIQRDLILKSHEVPDVSCPPVNPGGGGWYIDADDVSIDPIGHSSDSIDHMPFGSNPMRQSSDSPPFVELVVLDEVSPCDSKFIPRPISGTFPNIFDYQDYAIGPGGKGNDPATWPEQGLPPNWLKSVRYSYADPAQYTFWLTPQHEGFYSILQDYTALSCGPVELPNPQAAHGYSPLEGNRQSYLLKVVTADRPDDAITTASTGVERYWLYRYQDTVGSEETTPKRYRWYAWHDWQGSWGNEPSRRLSYRFGPSAVDTIAPRSVWSAQNFGSKNEYVNHLIGLDEDVSIPTTSGEVLPMYALADDAFLRWSEPYRFKDIRTPSPSNTFNGIAYPGSWAAFDGQVTDSDGPSDFQSTLREHYLGAVESSACPNLEISQAPAARTGFLPEGTAIYASRDGSGNRRWYRLYRFLTTPESEVVWRGVDSLQSVVGGHHPDEHSAYGRGPEVVLHSSEGLLAGSGNAAGATQALYHYPFRFAIADADQYGAYATVGHAVLERKDPMWWTVVDEYDSLSAALSASSSLTHDTISQTGWSRPHFSAEVPWMNRRVVAMNSAGLVLSDRTWDGSGGVNAPPAILDAYVYDDYLRLIMHLSRGWGSELVRGQNEEGEKGLVRILTYDDAIDEPVDPDGQPNSGDEFVRLNVPREVKGVWLNKGCLTPADPSHPDYNAQAVKPGEVHISEMLYYRDVFPNVPDRWAGQLYSQAVYDLLGNSDLGTLHHRVEYWEQELDQNNEPVDPDFDEKNPPVKWQINAGAQFQRDPIGPMLRPVEITFYNRKGSLVWRVYGSMAGLVSPGGSGSINADVNFTVGTHDELFLDYRQYDSHGREYFAVEDIDIPADTSEGIEETDAFNLHDIRFPLSGPQAVWPVDEEEDHGILFIGHADAADDEIATKLTEFWDRLNSDIGLLNGLYRKAEARPLDLITYREFNRFGVSKFVHPTGVRDVYQYILENDYLKELKAMGVEFDGTAWGFAGQQLYNSNFDGRQFVDQIQAVMDDLLANQWDGDPYKLESDIFIDNRIRVVAEVTPSYDSSGRMTGMAVRDPESGAEPVEQFVGYDGWGNILRSQDADGMVTHHTYDKFGRKHKTFTGSKDRHEIWGTADIGQDNDDMFLVEKLHYGLGTNDAGEVTHKWSFREKSPTQYGIDWDEPSEGDWTALSDFYTAGNSASGRTSSGLLETYEYDWRMRKIITRYQGIDSAQANTAVFREERVFLDNADRVRFVAVYEGPAGGGAPHPDIPPGVDLPEGADFFAGNAADNLLSLQETRYNGAGQTVEQRRYDPGSVDANNPEPGYFVVHNYTDHGNRPTWSRDSGQRISKNVYDARGRLVASSVFAGDVELSRTANQYGPTDTVDMFLRFERVDTEGTPTDSFNAADKRVTLTHQWYDGNKRLIASADFGEQIHSGTVDSYTVPLRPVDPPVRLVELASSVEPVNPNDPAPPPEQSPSRKLVGIDYPAAWIGTDGRGLARVTASWYGAIGQKNASLTLLSARKNSQNDIHLSYTIDRFEHNNFGQMVLEHRYGYEVADADSDENINAAAVFLGGTAYSYEMEGWADPQSSEPPPIFVSTKVRRIMPLTEGHGGAIVYNPNARRHTVDWANSTDPQLSTVIEYNAPVVQPSFNLPSFVLHPDPNDPYMFPIESDDWGHLGVSNRPDLVKAVHLPNPVSGADGDGLGYSLFYFYYADGLPALRLDSRGIAVRYIYDRSGNLLRLESDDGHLPLIASLGMTDAQLPANAIEYAYDGLDRLVRAATVRDYANGTTHRVDTESVIEYDRLGAMVKEYQSRDGSVNTGTTRFVGYAWEREYAQTDYTNGLALRDNIDRIASITYPARVGTHDAGSHSPRTLHFGYGDHGSVSDLLGRVEKVTASGGPTGAPLTKIATYQYTGIDRLEAVLLGQPVGGSSSDRILKDERTFDGFGRVESRTVTGWDGTSGYAPVMSSQFGYDLGGRRIFERLTQKDLNTSTSRNNTHSIFYGHDAAGRLVGEGYGRLKADGFEGIDHASSPAAPRVQSYGLDLLNRRVGAGSDPGLSIWQDLNKNGVVDTNEITTAHDHVVDKRGVLTGIDDGSAVTPVSHDAAGSITQYDGRNVYHDWLGRPVLVTSTGNGAPVVAYAYDAFGRLAKRTAPWPSDASSHRVEVYHYDGVRRIQEVFSDPVQGTAPWAPPPVFGDPPPPQTPQTRTEAEYVWSAAWGQPFDTCHVQIDWWDREAWFVQDHTTGTVRGYVDPSGELVEQYGFDAFGNLIRRDEFRLVKTGSQGYYNSFRQRLGHQGLFADRLQGHTNQRVMATGIDMWYQSRSRWYAPELGRFVTADPYGTGVPVQILLAKSGRIPSGPPTGSYDWEQHYHDGWDIFTAYGANPIQAQDPTGLFLANVLGGLFGGFSINQRDLLIAGGTLAGGAAIIAGVTAYQYQIDNLIDELGLNGGPLHISQADAVRKAESLVPQINLHFTKLTTPGGPRDPRNHWLKEIEKWVRQIESKIKHMKGKTQQEWLHRASEWRRRIQDIRAGE